jgi:hypothetical protein
VLSGVGYGRRADRGGDAPRDRCKRQDVNARCKRRCKRGRQLS